MVTRPEDQPTLPVALYGMPADMPEPSAVDGPAVEPTSGADWEPTPLGWGVLAVLVAVVVALGWFLVT